MHRRDALRTLGAVAIAPLLNPLSPDERWSLGSSLHDRLSTGERPQAGRGLSAAQLADVRALAETIIPRTDTPGAADVRAHQFVDLLVAEWYSDNDRQQLLTGLDALRDRCRSTRGNALSALKQPERDAFVRTIDGQRGAPGSAEAAYTRLKDAIIFAFLTSAEIAKLDKTPLMPGRFDGCVPV